MLLSDNFARYEQIVSFSIGIATFAYFVTYDLLNISCISHDCSIMAEETELNKQPEKLLTLTGTINMLRDDP